MLFDNDEREFAVLLVGDDRAEDHHDIEVMNEQGKRLAKARLPEGITGIARLHAIIAEHLGDNDDAAEVRIGIETDCGPWVAALITAGYAVYAVNPLQTARFRERHRVSGAKSDAVDAHTLADMVRTDAHQLRPVAGDSPLAEAVKVVARTHKTMIWERTRNTQRLRHALREYFPAALEAFTDLDAPDTLELLGKAPDPAAAARLSLNQIKAALTRAGRRDIEVKATRIQAILRSEQLGRHPVLEQAYAATTRSAVAVLITLDARVKTLQAEVEAHFGRHPAR